jgi:hypothetical protein
MHLCIHGLTSMSFDPAPRLVDGTNTWSREVRLKTDEGTLTITLFSHVRRNLLVPIPVHDASVALCAAAGVPFDDLPMPSNPPEYDSE